MRLGRGIPCYADHGINAKTDLWILKGFANGRGLRPIQVLSVGAIVREASNRGCKRRGLWYLKNPQDAAGSTRVFRGSRSRARTSLAIRRRGLQADEVRMGPGGVGDWPRCSVKWIWSSGLPHRSPVQWFYPRLDIRYCLTRKKRAFGDTLAHTLDLARWLYR